MQLFVSVQVEAEKQASLTVLEKKILPMEDLFSEFQAWLSASETSLSSLSPPSLLPEERAEQLSNAKVLTYIYIHMNIIYIHVHKILLNYIPIYMYKQLRKYVSLSLA